MPSRSYINLSTANFSISGFCRCLDLKYLPLHQFIINTTNFNSAARSACSKPTIYRKPLSWLYIFSAARGIFLLVVSGWMDGSLSRVSGKVLLFEEQRNVSVVPTRSTLRTILYIWFGCLQQPTSPIFIFRLDPPTSSLSNISFSSVSKVNICNRIVDAVYFPSESVVSFRWLLLP